MGVQGPLTAQALGRSPYDEVVAGEGDDDGHDPAQQYDHRGRPINPETKKINREIIRAHNEVMQVVGVAESDNLNVDLEAESQRRHEAYEASIGLGLGSISRRCVEAVGIFGVHGLRQRILIYKRYSEIPFVDLYRQGWKSLSFSRDIFAGAPGSLLSAYIERYVAWLWLDRTDRVIARQCVHEIWSYLKVHLEFYVSMQRLGLIPSSRWLPGLSYFIPFTRESPISAPLPMQGFGPQALLRWVGGFFISSAPFIVWIMTQRLARDWKPQIWNKIYERLPNTVFNARKIPPPLSPPPPPAIMRHESESADTVPTYSNRDDRAEDDAVNARSPHGNRPDANPEEEGVQRPHAVVVGDNPSNAQASHGDRAADDAGHGEERHRRQHVGPGTNDDFASDEEDNEGVSATLISFDVEATESTDAPAGLWSAELRPSQASMSAGAPRVLYLDTVLTRLPALMASHILTDAVARVAIAPYEAIALRLAARDFRLRRGLPCTDILSTNLLSGLNRHWIANFFGAELLHLVSLGEVWALFTMVSQWCHMDEDDWKAVDGTEASWLEGFW